MDFTAKQLLWGMLFGQPYLHTKKICRQDTHELKKKKKKSAVLGWNRVSFLPGSWHSALFWTCDQNSVDNTLMS